jgi:hypothetical protein
MAQRHHAEDGEKPHRGGPQPGMGKAMQRQVIRHQIEKRLHINEDLDREEGEKAHVGACGFQ